MTDRQTDKQMYILDVHMPQESSRKTSAGFLHTSQGNHISTQLYRLTDKVNYRVASILMRKFKVQPPNLCKLTIKLCAKLKYNLCTFQYVCTVHLSTCTVHLCTCTVHISTCTVHISTCTVHFCMCTVHFTYQFHATIINTHSTEQFYHILSLPYFTLTTYPGIRK